MAEKNKANRALEKLIAKKLRIGKTAVRITSGETSRSKTVRIDGNPDDLATAIQSLSAN